MWRCLLLWAVLLPVLEEAARRPRKQAAHETAPSFHRSAAGDPPAVCLRRAGPASGLLRSAAGGQSAELEKITPFFPGEVFYAHGLISATWYIYAPL